MAHLPGDNAVYQLARVIESKSTNQLDIVIISQMRRSAALFAADPVFYHNEYVLALEMGAGWLADHVMRGEAA